VGGVIAGEVKVDEGSTRLGYHLLKLLLLLVPEEVLLLIITLAVVDEDISTSATIIPSIEILGPITRSRAQQLNLQVNHSFH
jgi:hypothetical protein